MRFPAEVVGHWYCGSWYMYLSDLRDKEKYMGLSLDPKEIESPAPDQVAFNPYHTGHARSDTSGLIDGLIPAIRVGDKIGLYKQVGSRYQDTSFYDGLPWDDGYKIDLRFVRSVQA